MKFRFFQYLNYSAVEVAVCNSAEYEHLEDEEFK